jgi:hypothetical protein
MKTLCSLLLVFVAGLAHAANPLTNLLNLTYVNGTNPGGVYYASNVIVPLQKFTIQSLGITNAGYSGSYTTNGVTNCIVINLQMSVDASNTNWITLATYSPSTTNATVESLNAVVGQISIPMRMQVITTNALGVSVFTQP